MSIEMDHNEESFSEIVIALVSVVGTDLNRFITLIKEELELYEFNSEVVRISSDILNVLNDPVPELSKIETINHYMTLGNKFRDFSECNSALAYSAIAEISKRRLKFSGDEVKPLSKQAWIIRSLKHPEEVATLRETYGDSLYVIGIHSSTENRYEALKNQLKKHENESIVKDIIERDADEGPDTGHGQHTRDTFHLSDFFINQDQNLDKNKADIERVFKLIFAYPFLTPTFDEYAMYMAFSASTRSADLSRQVGAVLTKDKNIISTGANDVPTANGGLYWPYLDSETHQIKDVDDGRDYKRGQDSNKIEMYNIIKDIIEKLNLEDTEDTRNLIKKTKLADITEYGRVVHAEMEAILSCGRSNNSTLGTTIYCTTFPGHNCAKHIIAAGVKRVVYVEPYSKSKASEFHDDSIKDKQSEEYVIFEPFVGVGPRRFLNVFSLNLGSGREIKRKNSSGIIVDWDRESAKLRTEPDVMQYIRKEEFATAYTQELLNRYNKHDS